MILEKSYVEICSVNLLLQIILLQFALHRLLFSLFPPSPFHHQWKCQVELENHYATLSNITSSEPAAGVFYSIHFPVELCLTPASTQYFFREVEHLFWPVINSLKTDRHLHNKPIIHHIRFTQRKMKISQISAALVLIQGVAAFAPSRTIIQSPHQNVRSTSLGSAIQAVPSLPNPYKNLPWNVDREEARKQRRLTTENAALFRELGLPEDATYEDVAAKTKHLIELTEELPRNEGIKKKIKIEIARDKIYQIRLNERIAGVRTEQEDAARVQKWEEEGVDGV